MGNMIIVE